ncbi:hypothetical protein D9M68_946210 [compost metagenome]
MSSSSKVCTATGIDNTARYIYQQAAVLIHSHFGHGLQVSALCAYTRYQQEVFRNQLAHALQVFDTGCTDHKHGILRRTPGGNSL